MNNQEVAWSILVIGNHFIKVAFQDDLQFLRELLILNLVLRVVHHLYKLWSWVLFDLEDKQADRVSRQIILWTCHPLHLQQLLLPIVEHFDLPLNQELDVILGVRLSFTMHCGTNTGVFISLSRHHSLSSWELNIDLGVVGV